LVSRLVRKLASSRKLLRGVWLLAILVVIVGSLLPSYSAVMKAVDRLPVGDKVQHLAAYACLAFLPAIHEPRNRVFAAAVGAIALGVALEFAQLLSGWRDFEVADMLADALGVALGLALGWTVRMCVAAAGPDDATAQYGTAARTPRESAHRPAGQA